MGKKNKKKNKKNNKKTILLIEQKRESLANKYKVLFEDLENNGINVDEQFQELGGKDGFLRFLQDTEDDLSDNQTEIFKTAYREGDIRRCVRTIANIAQNDYYSHQSGLRNALYTEGNLLKNPLNYSFSQEDYEKTIKILVYSINYFNHLAEDKDSLVNKHMAELFGGELLQLHYLYECMYHNRMQNEMRLNDSGFLKHSLTQILHAILVFFQNQYSFSRDAELIELKEKGFATGFEIQVASEISTQNPFVKVSLADSIEQLIENMDALFRYLYYLKKDELEQTKDSFSKSVFLSPYESSDFLMLDHLALLDVLFTKLEASFRYSEWQIEKYSTPEGMLFCFSPSNDKAYKTSLAATSREKHRFMIESQIRMTGRERSSHMLFQEYIPTSERLELDNIESFHFDKREYSKLAAYMHPFKEATKGLSKPYYWKCRINNYYLEDYWNAYVFLYTFSRVYYCKAVKDDKLEKHVPKIHLQYLYDEFSAITGYDYDLAKELINCFVFDNEISKEKRFGDIFTRPLIGIGGGIVLMSEALISQMNIRRNIEVLLDWNNIILAPMGKELEKKLVRDLRNENEIEINTNKIEFLAYDGKNVEFDFLAVIDDYLLLIEMKSLLRPYDDDELYRRKKTISEGVDQVLRRVKIIQHDWDIIRTQSNIELPNKPFDEKHIIKVVCTDIYNYTGLADRGVIITDDATLLKYFLNPYIDGHILNQKEDNMVLRLHCLWKEGKPSAQELITYLHNPVTMKYLIESYEDEWKPLPVLKDYYMISFRDMAIMEDPMTKLTEIYGI